MGKKRRKNNNKNKLQIFVVFIAILIIIGFGGYSYLTYNDQYLNDLNSLEDAEEYIRDRIPEEIDSNFDFRDLDILVDNLKITYRSNNEEVIDEYGNVVRPSFLGNNVVVEVEIILEIIPDGVLASFYYNLLGGAKRNFKVSVTVLKLDLTAEEKVNLVSSNLYVPTITKSDVGLTTSVSFFDDITITWGSNNEAVITNSGEVVNTGHAVLLATVKAGEEQLTTSFPIEVVADFEDVIEVEEDFESIKLSTSYDTVDTVNGFIFNQTILNSENENTYLRMRAHSGASITYLQKIKDITKLSFDYFAITSSAFTNDVFLNIDVKFNNAVEYTTFKQILILDNNKHTANIDLSQFVGVTEIKITSSTTYSTMFIALDNLKVERKLSLNDVETALKEFIPKSLKSHYILPPSTPYGGKIEWASNNEEVLSKDGEVSRSKQSVVVQLTATITGVLDEFFVEYSINVLGSEYVTPVEVFFIDIGKYGDADNGESIYFKIGDIDILVDSGDNMSATRTAISEVIDQNSDDKVIDYVIATHPDADHIGSMKYIFDTYVVLNAVYFEGDHTTQLYQNFVSSVSNEDLVSECSILDSYNNQNGCKREIDLNPGVKIEFIDTGYYETDETNGRSIVFVLDAYGTRLLMTGDADNGNGRSLESSYMNKVGDVDILKVVHHGTREGTTLDFLKAVDPEYAIITNGNYFGNKHGHPTFEAINRIYQYDNNIDIYAVVGGDSEECSYTTSYKCEVNDRFVDRNGTIKITIDNNGFSFSSEYNDEMIELSTTVFWSNHPYKEFEHAK